MRTISELVLNFLLNACWQVALVAAAAVFCAWLLRETSIRYRHLLWAGALALSLSVPLLTPLSSLRRSTSAIFPTESQETAIQPILVPISLPQLKAADAPTPYPNSPTRMGRNLAAFLLVAYLLFVSLRLFKLFQAWKRTRIIIRSSTPIVPDARLYGIIEKCQIAICMAHARILSSNSIAVPVTVGARRPLIILPEQLLREADEDVLTSAIGHELVHVWRRDYVLNLLYELIYLPLSFHPATALVRRRINQTRELCCDELVAERLLDPQVYARSLVQLAGSAPPLRPLAVNTTVGIADADILEVRIMSLLKKTKYVRRRRLLLVAAALVLFALCIGSAAFAFHFDIDPQDSSLNWVQEPSQEIQEKQEMEAREKRKHEELAMQEREFVELKERLGKETNPQVRAELENKLHRIQELRAGMGAMTARQELATQERLAQELKERIEKETNAQVRAELEAKLHGLQEERSRVGWAMKEREELVAREREFLELKERIEKETNTQVRAELEANLHRLKEEMQGMRESKVFTFEGSTFEMRTRQAQEEAEMKARQAELARRAKITMDQAIQIATSQNPGKVLECSLNGEHWEAAGELAKPALVFYHVVILSGDESSPRTTHVLVNALDGQILKTGKERSRNEER